MAFSVCKKKARLLGLLSVCLRHPVRLSMLFGALSHGCVWMCDGEESRLSALLWFLVSPRNLPKSPDRSAVRTYVQGEHWGEEGCAASVIPLTGVRSLQSREGCHHKGQRITFRLDVDAKKQIVARGNERELV